MVTRRWVRASSRQIAARRTMSGSITTTAMPSAATATIATSAARSIVRRRITAGDLLAA